MIAIPERLAAALADRYRIERELGQGGMATVYLAQDVKHDRKVALKVLKPELAAVLGAERFVVEIKTTASLQHPHILPLFDSGRADGFLYYVMPYIEGETLRAKLDRETQLGIEEAVRITTQVADALDYAHRHGVIHRDIKPENILLHDGRPMVVDFGIALAVSAAAGGRITETGLSLGTPHYMSPEQATAEKDITARSDVYSLASVLYEMLTGQPPHLGGSAQQIIMKIIAEPVQPVTTLRKSVPANVAAAVAKALEKLPADRFAGAGAFAEALSDRAFEIARTPDRENPARAAAARYVWPALFVASLALAWLGWHRSAGTGGVQRLHLALPEGHQMDVQGARSDPFDISPDGRRLIYQNQVGGSSQLVVRDMGSFESRVLGGTEGAGQPFFSPDGEWIAFFAAGSLHRVSVNGGSPIRISEAKGATFGGSWGPDGRILYVANGALYLVDAAGSAPVQIPVNPVRQGTPADTASIPVAPVNLRWPHILPDGKHGLVSVNAGTLVVNLDTHDVRYVFSGFEAQYLPTGHLVFHAGEGRIRVVRFDLDHMEVTGPEIPVVDNVFRGPSTGVANFAVAANAGTLIYAQGSFNRELVLVDRNGRMETVPAAARGYRFPAVSPDGRYVAVTVEPRPNDLWIIDLVRGNAERQQTETHDGWGVWSPDGKRIAFIWGVGAPMGWRMFPFSADPVPIRRAGSEPIYPKAWTRDDRLLSHTGADIVTVSVRDGTVEKILATDALETAPTLSPDGRWMAFVSDVSGASEVYVSRYPEPAERYPVSAGGGVDPAWAANGSELYFRRGDAILAVPVRTAGASRPWDRLSSCSPAHSISRRSPTGTSCPTAGFS